MPIYDYPDFKRNAVQPIECIKEGWELIKDRFWLFVGMSVVGILIGSSVPFGILMGPMMCGIFLALFRQMRCDSVEFSTLFKGFDYFGQSLIASLLHFIPIVIVMLPFNLIFFLGAILTTPSERGEAGAIPAALVAAILIGVLVILLVVMIFSVLFMFAYPLIVERNLGGFDAVKLSFKAGLANFWRLLGLMLLNGLLTLGGLLLCHVGLFFVLPITFAALANAYRQVFGVKAATSPYPPAPPVFGEAA